MVTGLGALSGHRFNPTVGDEPDEGNDEINHKGGERANKGNGDGDAIKDQGSDSFGIASDGLSDDGILALQADEKLDEDGKGRVGAGRLFVKE